MELLGGNRFFVLSLFLREPMNVECRTILLKDVVTLTTFLRILQSYEKKLLRVQSVFHRSFVDCDQRYDIFQAQSQPHSRLVRNLLFRFQVVFDLLTGLFDSSLT